MDASSEKITPVYDEAFDLSGLAKLRPVLQGWCPSERSAGSVLAALPLVLTQQLAQMGLKPGQCAAERVRAENYGHAV